MTNKKHMEEIRSKMKVRPAAAAVALAMLAWVDTSAFAQQAKGPELETVVVTANKRVEKVENVPMAISVVNEELIERNNVREVEDLMQLVPAIGMIEGSTSANTSISMRGIGSITNTIGIESDVSVIIDDIPIANQFQAFRDLADVSRVEVLKGPQSTLFGKSAVAGAINITTKPISGPLTARGRLYYTNDGEWRIGASYGGKISERLGVRISANKSSYGGPLHNLTNGQDVGGSSGKTFIAKLSWHPTPNLDFDFSPRYNYQVDSKGVGALTSFVVSTGSAAAGTLKTEQAGLAGSNSLAPLYFNGNPQLPASRVLAGINPSQGNLNLRRDFPSGLISSDFGLGFKVNYTLPNGATLTSISSSDKYRSTDPRDQDFTDVSTVAKPVFDPVTKKVISAKLTDPLVMGSIQSGTYDIRAKTQEIRLVSSDTGTFRYVAGLWYAKSETYRFFNRGYCEAPAPCELTTASRFANGAVIPAVQVGAPNTVVYNTYLYNTNKAIFGQFSWEFSPSYTLVAGLRNNLENSGYWFGRNYFTTMTPKTFFANPSGQDYFQDLGTKDHSISGKLSLQRQFTKEWMGYAMAATGHKGVAYTILSGLSGEVSGATPPEDSQTMELGAKGNLMHNRMSVAASIFETEFFNYQHSQNFTLPGDPTTYTQVDSIPRARTRGVELDTAIMVTPKWRLNLSAAYTEATIANWKNGSCANDASNKGLNGSIPGRSVKCFPVYAGDKAGEQDNSGTSLPKAPKVKVTMGNSYDLRFASLPFNGNVHMNVKYQGAAYSGFINSGNPNSPPVTMVDFGFGIKEKKDVYRLSFSVHNLLDHQYSFTGGGQTGSFRSDATTPVPAGVVPATVTTSTWAPRRDSNRYFSVKFDVKY